MKLLDEKSLLMRSGDSHVRGSEMESGGVMSTVNCFDRDGWQTTSGGSKLLFQKSAKSSDVLYLRGQVKVTDDAALQASGLDDGHLTSASKSAVFRELFPRCVHDDVQQSDVSDVFQLQLQVNMSNCGTE